MYQIYERTDYLRQIYAKSQAKHRLFMSTIVCRAKPSKGTSIYYVITNGRGLENGNFLIRSVLKVVPNGRGVRKPKILIT